MSDEPRKKRKPPTAKLRKTRDRLKNGQAPQTKYSVEQVADALRACDGLKMPTARKLKIAYSTLKGYLERHPELEDVIDECDEDMVDLSESKLKRHIKSGSLDAVKYHLDRKGKKRGYVRQQEIAGVSDKPLNINIVPATGHKEEEEE